MRKVANICALEALTRRHWRHIVNTRDPCWKMSDTRSVGGSSVSACWRRVRRCFWVTLVRSCFAEDEQSEGDEKEEPRSAQLRHAEPFQVEVDDCLLQQLYADELVEWATAHTALAKFFDGSDKDCVVAPSVCDFHAAVCGVFGVVSALVLNATCQRESERDTHTHRLTCCTRTHTCTHLHTPAHTYTHALHARTRCTHGLPSGRPSPIFRRSCSLSQPRTSQSMLPPCSARAALATGLGYRRRGYSSVRPFLCYPSCGLPRLGTCPLSGFYANGNGNAPVQAPASLGHPRFRMSSIQTENSQLVPFRKKRSKEAKELIVLNSLIPDCLPHSRSFVQRGIFARSQMLTEFCPGGCPLWEVFCSLPKAHDHHLVHRVHVFADGSVDYDEAQPSSPLPPSALSAGFSRVVFVACGKELPFLGAFWSPLFQHFSQCKNPSASQSSPQSPPR